MRLILEFDASLYTMFIPDGYVDDLHRLQLDFFDWLYDQPDHLLDAPSKRLAASYGPEDFAAFVNEVLLKDCHERAYIERGCSIGRGLRRLRF